MNLHNGKDNAFRALGFPSKMPYENRSKLRKMAGRFVRFSYLVDLIYLNGLAGIFTQQVSWFIGTLEEIQLGEEVRKWCPGDDGKGQNQEEVEKEKMFQMQIECTFKEIPDEMVEHVSLRRFEFSEAIE